LGDLEPALEQFRANVEDLGDGHLGAGVVKTEPTGIELRSWVERAESEAHPCERCVYVLEGRGVSTNPELKDDEHFCKIGVSVDPKRRAKELRRRYDWDIRVLHVICTRSALCVEGVLHTAFAEKHIGGEWFRLSKDDLAWLGSLQWVDGDRLWDIVVEEMGLREASELLHNYWPPEYLRL
jgi:hypothetical protein